MHDSRRAFQNAELHPARLRLCAGLGSAVLLALLCGFICASAGRAQSSGGSNGSQESSHPFTPHVDITTLSVDDPNPAMIERRILALNIERQKQMVADADKLLKLARELNEEVAKANTGTLTADELHKIAEIEKLARNVRQRMTDTAGLGPDMFPLPQPPPTMYPTH